MAQPAVVGQFQRHPLRLRQRRQRRPHAVDLFSSDQGALRARTGIGDCRQTAIGRTPGPRLTLAQAVDGS